MQISEKFYRYVYKSAMWVFGVSLVLLAFMQGFVPFGLKASWSGTGYSNTLVLVHGSHAPAVVGDRVVATMYAEQGKVAVFSVGEVVRNDGALLYRASEPSVPLAQPLIPAWDVTGSVVAAVPVLGTWVRALSNTVGLAALLGVPIVMLLLNMLLSLTRRFTEVFAHAARHTEVNPIATSHKLVQNKTPKTVDSAAYVVAEDYEISTPHAEVSVDGVVYIYDRAPTKRQQAVPKQENKKTSFVRSIEGILLPQRHYGV